MQERRQNVRVRPTAEYGIVIDLGTGLVKTRLAVIDIAVGGVGLEVEEQFVDMPAGTELRVGVTLPGVPRFETVGIIRYTQRRVGGRCGVHFNHLTHDQQAALSRTVSELLERGFSA
ncbi:MAG TPA: PilZ domain-containing protein [Polyangiales bacterium]